MTWSFGQLLRDLSRFWGQNPHLMLQALCWFTHFWPEECGSLKEWQSTMQICCLSEMFRWCFILTWGFVDCTQVSNRSFLRGMIFPTVYLHNFAKSFLCLAEILSAQLCPENSTKAMDSNHGCGCREFRNSHLVVFPPLTITLFGWSSLCQNTSAILVIFIWSSTVFTLLVGTVRPAKAVMGTRIQKLTPSLCAETVASWFVLVQ